MPKLTKKLSVTDIRTDGRTDPNYRKVLLLKNRQAAYDKKETTE